MVSVDVPFGILMVVIGIILLALELAHPGVLLFIPGSIIMVAGFLYLLLPDVLLDSIFGPIIVIVAAIIATLIEMRYLLWIAKPGEPMSTTTAGLIGESAIVTVAIVPHTLKGKVRVRSEIWSAISDQPIPEGTQVRVVHGEGVSLRVEPVDPAAPKSTA